MIKRKDRERDGGFTDLIDYNATIAPGVQVLTSGAFLMAWKLRGPDAESMPIEESASMCAKIAQAFRLGAGWTVQSDQFQDQAPRYTTVNAWPDTISQLVDRERRIAFEAKGPAARFQSDFYLCVSYLPPRQPGQKGVEWMFGDNEHEGQASRDLKIFGWRVSEIDRALRSGLLCAPGTSVHRLASVTEGGQRYDELSRYIRRCIIQEDFRFAWPSQPFFLHQLLAVDFTGGRHPLVDDEHLRVLALNKFPDREGTGSYPGVLAGLEALPFRFRFVQQGRCIPEMEAKKLHEKDEARWAVVKTGVFRKGGVANGNAQKLEDESHVAAEDAEYGKQYYVHYSAKILLLGRDEAELDEQRRIIKDTLREVGIDVVLETRNAVRGFLSSLPGHAQKERRRFLATVDNLSQMAQLTAPYTGPDWNPWDKLPAHTPPLFWASTLGRVPYRFHVHVTKDGVAHVVLVGPSGTGKTTLLGLMIAQHCRLHPLAQTFIFDKDFTQYTLIQGMGGDYYTLLGGDDALRLCPLEDLETADDRVWAAGYIEMLCTLNGYEPDAGERNVINGAVETLAGEDDHSITQLQSIIGPQAEKIAEALQVYTIGAAGGILDGTRDGLALGRLCAFEMGSIYKMDPKIASAVLFYIFHRIEQRLNPCIPTLIGIDEFRQALEQPLAAKKFGHFLEQGRKLGGWCAISIQETRKIHESPLAQTISRECLTKVFLPNPSAATGERVAYEVLGATDQDIAYIAAGTRCRDYYVVSPHGRRYITLDLGELALAFLAHSGEDDRMEVDLLRRKHPGNWQAYWLRRWGLPEWAYEFELVAGIKEPGRVHALA